jgi:nucleoid-associated protein YgaU
MKTNPLLEELWRAKDDLAREAGYDIDRIFAELRAAEARQPGLLIRSADELRRYVADQEHRREAAVTRALKEEPPPAPPDHPADSPSHV